MRSFFYLQKNDRNALLAVLAVLVASLAAIAYIGSGRSSSSQTLPGDSLRRHDGRYVDASVSRSRGMTYECAVKCELTEFDPNTADSTQLLSLGLPPWQVRNIYRYRAGGGVFRSKRDFARIYGLTAKKYRELEPYIRISDDYRPAAEVYGRRQAAGMAVRDTLRYPLKIKPGEHIVLNTADTSLLKRVPGIGSAYARAIVSYGRRLGGYVSVEQLREIDGFPEESMAYFVVKNPVVSKLNLNTLPLSRLRRHPYVGFYQARTIIEYRRVHGKINSLDDLKLYKDFTPDVIARLRPYVEF